MRFSAILGLAGLLAAAAFAKPEINIQGFGWVQTGMIGNATDTLRFNFNNNWMQTAATQITADVIVDEHWDGALGIGAGQEHPMQGNTQNARLLRVSIATYITQANFTYTAGERGHAKFSATFG
ncbi:MAG: hypothetical protein JWO30_4651, partial [Fibrobacteres bacterium]|nr:hypothetical protein [Fibrobacterota bacterium]